ncbi:MAG: hypothetical protein MK142_07105, partial [Pseudomonadales bacterium]|nr:hypothetical protein [Pseudomonadales bacterium]
AVRVLTASPRPYRSAGAIGRNTNQGLSRPASHKHRGRQRSDAWVEGHREAERIFIGDPTRLCARQRTAVATA